MFSLIVSIIGILLVVLLVIALIYYGGSAITQGQVKAQAAQLIDESTQIMNALEAYKADNASTLPSSMTDLINGGYLNSAPPNSWTFSTDSVTSTNVNQAECMAANQLLGYSYSVVPSCSTVDPSRTVCCQ